MPPVSAAPEVAATILRPHTCAGPIGAEGFRAAVMNAERELSMLVARQREQKPIAVTVKLRGQRIRIGFSWRSDSAEPGVATIVRVVPGSPAACADLRVSDRIYSAGGESLERPEQLQEILRRNAKSIELLVERRGQMRTVAIDGI